MLYFYISWHRYRNDSWNPNSNNEVQKKVTSVFIVKKKKANKTVSLDPIMNKNLFKIEENKNVCILTILKNNYCHLNNYKKVCVDVHAGATL